MRQTRAMTKLQGLEDQKVEKKVLETAHILLSLRSYHRSKQHDEVFKVKQRAVVAREQHH